MFSPHQAPSQSSERIIFRLSEEKETFDRSFYHPYLTADQLSTEEVDDTLSQIDQIYRKKEDHIYMTAFLSASFYGIFWFRFDLPSSIPYNLKKPVSRGINTLIFGSISLYIWNQNKKAKKKACELLEQANQKTVPRGFRWYFPQSFSKIELYPDYTYDPNQLFTDENEASPEVL